jgi:hypothetical protein
MCVSKIRLYFREMAQIADTAGLSVVVLTDEFLLRALTIICDEPMTQQLLIRINHLPGEETMLPEALTEMLFLQNHNQDKDFELFVYDVREGQYLVDFSCISTGASVHVRVSDAILLSTFTDIPLFIDENLFQQQSSAYVPHTSGLIIPINTISLEQLNEELKKAIAEENYRLASSLHEEIIKRNKQ